MKNTRYVFHKNNMELSMKKYTIRWFLCRSEWRYNEFCCYNECRYKEGSFIVMAMFIYAFLWLKNISMKYFHSNSEMAHLYMYMYIWQRYGEQLGEKYF